MINSHDKSRYIEPLQSLSVDPIVLGVFWDQSVGCDGPSDTYISSTPQLLIELLTR